MPLQPGQQAPYTSVSAILTVLDAYRERGLGTPITPDVLIRARVSESIANRTVQSLRLLDLVDENGQPTPQFEAFKEARADEEYRERLQEWLRAVYADVLGYANPSTSSLTDVQEAFHTYEPAGQRKAMAALLMGLWQYAGLPVTSTDSGPSTRRPRPTSTQTRRSQTTKRRKPEPQAQHLAEMSPGLVGLLREIPGNGATWTSKRRESFLKAFAAMLDFTVQVDDSPEEGDDTDLPVSDQEVLS